jgi:hypothetical protein
MTEKEAIQRMVSENKNIPHWVKQRKEEIEGERLPFYKIEQGETVIEVDTDVVPTMREGDYSKQYLYNITVEGEAYKLSASAYLDRLIIEALSAGINPFTLVRKGTEKKTKYSIKELS